MYKKNSGYKNISSSESGKKRPEKLLDTKKSKKKSEISPAMMKRLKEHAKLHKGGMESAHMKSMVKSIKEGMSFSAAHNKAVEMDKKKKSKK